MEEAMFGGSKESLNWRTRFIDTIERCFKHSAIDLEAVMPDSYKQLLEEAADDFTNAFKQVKVDDTLYDDVQDIGAYRTLTSHVAELNIWTTGDIPNAHQRSKIINSRILQIINKGTGENLLRRNDIVADKKAPPLQDAIEAFVKAQNPTHLVVTIFDDSESSMLQAANTLEQWQTANPYGPKIYPLLVRAKRGKFAQQEWTMLDAREAKDLYELIHIIDEQAAGIPGTTRENCMAFLDFDGSLSNNAIVRERQRELASTKLHDFFERVVDAYVVHYTPKTQREEEKNSLFRKIKFFLADLAGPETPDDAFIEEFRAKHRAPTSYATAIIRTMIYSVRMKLILFDRTHDHSHLEFENEISALQDVLRNREAVSEVKEIAQNTLKTLYDLIGFEKKKETRIIKSLYIHFFLEAIKKGELTEEDMKREIKENGNLAKRFLAWSRALGGLVQFDYNGDPPDPDHHSIRIDEEIVTAQEIGEEFRKAYGNIQVPNHQYIQELAPAAAIVEERIKSVPSILLKLFKEKKTHIGEITDLAGYRILTDTREECEAIYARVKQDMEPNQRKELITIDDPTPNGYRSMDITGILHESGQRMQVQLRTKEIEDKRWYDRSNDRNYKHESAKKLMVNIIKNTDEYVKLMITIYYNLASTYRKIKKMKNPSDQQVVDAFRPEKETN